VLICRVLEAGHSPTAIPGAPLLDLLNQNLQAGVQDYVSASSLMVLRSAEGFDQLP
jgi:hypothetical protein